ncbi:MAG: sulfur oxidation c-type cytochrome SoxX [Hyphomicrobiales bacterium]|nr:sulfur oxidation c-type cytochrome SoxX [Hyphomicrobiales bacterium]
MFYKALVALIFGLSSITVAAAAQTAPAPDTLKIVNGEVPKPLTDVPGNAVAGRAVFLDRKEGNCYACHTVTLLKDQPFPGEIGPKLDGVGNKYTVGQMRLILTNSKLMFPGTIMPAFYHLAGLKRVPAKLKGKTILTPQQVEDVIAFLQTLK